MSRDQYYNVKSIKYPVPPCGAYNINYKPVDKVYKPLQWNTPKNEPRRVKEKVEPDPRLIEIPNTDHNVYLDFKRATGRE